MSAKTYTAEQMFPELIGQDRVKKQLGFHFKGYMANGRMPHLMFTAPRGCGKTTLASALADCLKWREPNKRKIVFNCSQLRNLRQFWNEIIIPHVNDKDVTVLFDEASEMPKDVMMALLTVLNPNAAGRTQFSYEDYTVDFDFSRQTFMFATTEGQSIFHALMDRMERIDLQEYSEEELGKITKIGLDDYVVDDDALDQIATVLRGNPRAAAKMKDKIVAYCDGNDKKRFTLEDWDALRDELDILPLGLLNKELELLRILTRKSETRLTELAAITCLSKGSIQKDYEMFLMKQGLMEIQPTGRSLTARGREYLKALDKNK
tara:strand:+ start:1210 stop:2169 length:960 start_codon:yes stop_codon:yes gene_type:complete